ncbi:MgtE intracellular region [Thermodesulfobium narugense DSM 14796]|uniref:MgtE intracellular region n=1 Tax=Thermodesulfobium narugense DSM 14796 TaxID=747365 RepID=M1E6L4_9BACT|nr:MgtE integral membrane protein [Thermodesulfobium narugense]AEE13664.1 MgtE intracellular region [Thermodesulfobium narugense DSM 14796]
MKWLMILGFLIIVIVGTAAGLYFSGTVKFPFLPSQKSEKNQSSPDIVQNQSSEKSTLLPQNQSKTEQSQNINNNSSSINQNQKNIIQTAAEKAKQQEELKLQREAKVLSNMDPSDAAKIIDNMDISLAAKILSYMNNKEASDILSELTSSDPKKATKLLNMMGASSGG